MIRLDCLKVLREIVPDDTLVVVTLGVTTDEWYDLGHREASMYLPAMGTITPLSSDLRWRCHTGGCWRSTLMAACYCRSGR